MMNQIIFFCCLSIFLFPSPVHAASKIQFRDLEIDIARRRVSPSFSIRLNYVEGLTDQGIRETRYFLTVEKFSDRKAFDSGKHDEREFKMLNESQYNSLINKFMDIDFSTIVQSYEDDYRPIDTSNWKVKGYGPGFSIDYWFNCPMLRKSAHTLAAFVSELDDLTDMDLLVHVIPAGSEMDKWNKSRNQKLNRKPEGVRVNRK